MDLNSPIDGSMIEFGSVAGLEHRFNFIFKYT